MDNENKVIIDDKRAERADLISQLTSPYSEIGDWKLAKQQEAILLNEQKPYTDAQMKEYGDKRAAARARINELDAEIAELEQ